MKIVKMSLIAAVLVGSSAFAISNVKVSGNASLYYNSNDAQRTGGVNPSNADTSGSLFSSANSAAQAELGLGLTADLTKGISAGAHMVALSTLGLQGQLVSNVWEKTNGLTDSYWFDEAWIAGTYGKTTAKIGRMKLDTPLLFTESWSIVENTFEAAVLVNQDIPNTTLVGAYVGGSNGASLVNAKGNPTVVGSVAGGVGGRIQGMTGSSSSNFSSFYNGAYAVGAINNSWKPLTLQAWYYDAPQYVQDFWAQADFAMAGFLGGAQFTNISYATSTQMTTALGVTESDSNNAYALMFGYTMPKLITAKVSFSQVGESKTGLGAGQNLATLGNNAESKLYTEAWWNYGYVTKANSTAFNITLTSPLEGLFDLGLYYTHVSAPGYTKGTHTGSSIGGDGNMNEFTVTAGKKFGPLDATLAYISTKAGNENVKNPGETGSQYNTVQAYLTYNF